MSKSWIAMAACMALGASLAGRPARAADERPALPQTVDVKLILNHRLTEPWLATAGKPTDEGLRQLAALGVRTVVDLRTEGEGTAAERQAVEAAGLRYVWVPVTPASFRTTPP